MPITTEEARAEAVAEEYRRQGYDVVREPSSQELPDFLSGFQPDLLVRRGGEHIVVEVKSRPSLATESQVRELARLLQDRPGWRFELVVVEGERAKLPAGVSPLTKEDVQRGVTEAARLNDSGSAAAALLLAWAMAEAAVRGLLEREEVALQRLTPSSVLKQAVNEGLLPREDHDLLLRVLEYRNAISHGFRPSGSASDLTRDLLEITNRLLD